VKALFFQMRPDIRKRNVPVFSGFSPARPSDSEDKYGVLVE